MSCLKLFFLRGIATGPNKGRFDLVETGLQDEGFQLIQFGRKLSFICLYFLSGWHFSIENKIISESQISK